MKKVYNDLYSISGSANQRAHRLSADPLIQVMNLKNLIHAHL